MCSILYHPAAEVCRQKTDAFVKVRAKKNLDGWGCVAKNSVGKGVGVVRILSFFFLFFFFFPRHGLDWIGFILDTAGVKFVYGMLGEEDPCGLRVAMRS
ncbi:hypothetical protein CDAR_177781 [Caerostris darwini]|uniref:Uncharacterized protein n=1 Tax=Caerostris darwini TaxID=1538125 RepID=A0AAV4RI60_9ARAC|nr:hypothetical protein CDAR_177781 [Caerostris darwini]